jgi:hypothetical protein
VKINTLAVWQRIFDFGTGTTNYMFLTTQYGTGGSANRLRFAITTSGNVNEQRISSSVPTPSGEWAHVAVVLAGSTGSLYLNGSLVGQNSAMTLNPSSLGTTTQNYIGKSQWPDPYLNAAVDDFRIYSFAMNAEEIAAHASPLNSPQNVAALEQPLAIRLSWNSVAAAASYIVRLASSSGGPYEILADGLTSTDYLHEGLGSGETRFYTVAAANSIYTSDPSSEVSATAESPAIEPAELAFSFDVEGQMSSSITILQSVLGHQYRLQRSPDLSTGSWIDVGAPLAGNGVQLPIPLSINPDSSSGFFRVVVTR